MLSEDLKMIYPQCFEMISMRGIVCITHNMYIMNIKLLAEKKKKEKSQLKVWSKGEK